MPNVFVLCYMNKQRRDKILMKSVGLKLQKFRDARDIPQEKVTFDTGVNIGKLELGKTNISLTTLSILCKYYGYTLEELFRDIETE